MFDALRRQKTVGLLPLTFSFRGIPVIHVGIPAYQVQAGPSCTYGHHEHVHSPQGSSLI